MFKKEKDGMKEFTKEELQDILKDVRELSMEELESVVGGVGSEGDDREFFTMDPAEINTSIFGTRL